MSKPLLRPDGLPFFLTTQEAADLLRITRKALYVMVERGTIPGVIRRSQRRIVFDTDVLLQWLRQQQCAIGRSSNVEQAR